MCVDDGIGLVFPRGVAAGGGGRVFVTSSVAGAVFLYVDDVFTERYPLTNDNGEPAAPRHVDVAEDGSLVVEVL